VSEYTRAQLERAALVTIDVQADVLDGRPLEVPGSAAALPAIVRLAQAFRAAGLPIVHIVRLYRADGSNVDACRRQAVIDGWQALAPGSPGSELPAGLAPPASASLDCELLLRGEIQHLADREVVIYKPRWGAFFETPLHAHLRELGMSTLVFAGFNFPNCPRTSIYEASERDFRIVLVSDAVSGLYERGAAELANIGVELLHSEELVVRLAPEALAAPSA
jgi:nicotinamidase-related amidase